MKSLTDQDLMRTVDALKGQLDDYKERIRMLIEGEVHLRDGLETTVKELEICKERYKSKVKECDALEV